MIFALTGGFGCGKSSALAFFEDAGWQTSSADDICAELYNQQEPKIMVPLCKRWGDKVFYSDGTVDKKAIAKIVFNSGEELEWLCSLLYPLIAERIKKITEKNREKNFIFEVPLLFEANWDKMFDKTIAVWVESEIQKKRLLDKGFSIDEINQRNAKQLPNSIKLERAYFVLVNNGDLEMLKKQCNNLISYIYKEQN